MKKKRSVGRPKLNLDPEQVRSLSAIQCTMIEMSHVLKCSVDHLEQNFSDIIKEGRTQGVMSVKRKQYELAMQGDKTMLVWFGKNYCGQSDRQEIRSENLHVVHNTKEDDPQLKAKLVEEIQTMIDDLRQCRTPLSPFSPESSPPSCLPPSRGE